MKKIIFFITIFSYLFSGISLAKETVVPEIFYNRSKEGWFWYQDPVKEEPKKEEKKEITPKKEQTEKEKTPSKDKDPWDMSVDEFKVVLEDARKTAIDNPSEDNVLYYVYLQDIALRKSRQFANTFSYIVQKYPQFSPTLDFPIVDPGQRAINKVRSQEIDLRLQSEKNDFGLVYFYDPECQVCAAMEPILGYYIDKFGWEVKRVNVVRDYSLAQRFDVERVPYILIVSRQKGNYLPVSMGAVSLADLELRIYRSIRFLKDEIQPKDWANYQYQDGGIFDTQTKPENPLRNR